MADQQRLKHSISRLQGIKTWQLIIVFILVSFVAATFLRMNNTNMIARRNAIAAADKTGDLVDISNRVYDLQAYTASHMNASTGVFYLQEQYNRDVKTAVDATSNISSDSARANAEAEAICHPQFYGYSTAYMRCFLDELAKHPTADKLPEAKLPSPAQYRYSFVSPIWSPDFAGFSVLVCGTIVLIIVGRLVSLAILRLLLRRHYREA